MRQFLLHPVITRRELCSSGHHERMRRRAQGAVGTVNLPPGSTTADQAKIADTFGGANTLEDERHAWVKTLRSAFVKSGDIKTLRRHARASHRLWSASHAPPHTSKLTGETVIILATFSLPGA